jgi:hypothetical protein
MGWSDHPQVVKHRILAAKEELLELVQQFASHSIDIYLTTDLVQAYSFSLGVWPVLASESLAAASRFDAVVAGVGVALVELADM